MAFFHFPPKFGDVPLELDRWAV